MRSWPSTRSVVGNFRFELELTGDRIVTQGLCPDRMDPHVAEPIVFDERLDEGNGLHLFDQAIRKSDNARRARVGPPIGKRSAKRSRTQSGCPRWWRRFPGWPSDRPREVCPRRPWREHTGRRSELPS